jgi:ferredoxin-NADP reductase
MLRHRSEAGSVVPARLLYSARSPDEVIYRDELERLAAVDDGLVVAHTLTRAQPPGWSGYARRVDREMLEEVFGGQEPGAAAFVCGPTGFVESVADALVELDYDTGRIRTERFGPTGG